LHLVSDGTDQPYRMKIRRPSFINLAVLPEIAIGEKVADLVITLGSTDIVMGEVDG
jgi:NADH:ubiquinone oxidoreductase subunit D